jgi:hypothetical protein
MLESAVLSEPSVRGALKDIVMGIEMADSGNAHAFELLIVLAFLTRAMISS